MKIAILGDCHFGMRGDSLDFHRYYQKFYDTVFFPYLIENKIDTIFQLGDLFDRRKYINFNSLFLARKYFFDKLKSHGIKLHTLLGNHDIAYKNTLEVNSTSLLLNGYENIIIHKDFTTINFSDIDVDIVPWLCDENIENIFLRMKDSKSQICFGHFEINGFEMDRGNVCHEGIDRNTLNKYDMVLTGHFHHKSDDGHIFYVGTPGEMTWADHDDPRGFHIFDVTSRQLEFIKNPYHMFHKVIYDDIENNFEFWSKYDFESFRECYVKVVVINKQNPYLFDTVVDNFYKAGISDLSIVEDFSEIVIEDDLELVNQSEDTLTIINKIIDNLTQDIDTKKLKSFIKEVYLEALSVEQNS